ncbi:MAG: type II toxin-antitoxin system VapC family toxin [Desulfobacteraceae bacterium]|nr:type II toxin-antitoxin system VapC family toxin [Desulfobacteraceae bacterium]
MFLWFISGDERLSELVRDEIQHPENEVFLSPVSIWECIIKYQIGKLPLPETPAVYLPRQRKRHFISSLPLDENSAIRLITLPPVHRDPFDRMLICQAIENNLIIVTADGTICSYPVRTMNGKK